MYLYNTFPFSRAQTRFYLINRVLLTLLSSSSIFSSIYRSLFSHIIIFDIKLSIYEIMKENMRYSIFIIYNNIDYRCKLYRGREIFSDSRYKRFTWNKVEF
jgi:hypothetical protein